MYEKVNQILIFSFYCYRTAIIDVICTSLLVVAFTWLSSNGYASLEAETQDN